MKNAAKTLRMNVLIILSLLSIQLVAQDFSLKYGKVTDDELKMTTYEADTTASAVVLFKEGTTYYEYIAGNFRVIYEVAAKIKILKPEGTEYADISIPYYSNERNPMLKENISNIDATSYNMENGKVERAKMKKEYIFKERLSNSYMQIKFSIPSVKVGSVIEYKYKMYSDIFYELDNWEMQQEIPVLYSRYEVSIPEYFKFNLDMRGGQNIKREDTTIPFNMYVRFTDGTADNIQSSARKLIFTGKNLPAMKADSYVWYPKDFISKIDFELNGVEIPGALYQSFGTTWRNIDEILLKDEDFGKYLKMKNPLQEEMKSISLEGLTTDEKVARIYTFLKERITWNEEYALYGSNIRKSIKEGNANNATLNFIFMSMLRDAGITSYPLVMSRRSRGILPYAHPSISKINTFIVGIMGDDEKMMFLDGSVTDGYINILPPVLLVDRARIVSEKGGDSWVALKRLGRNQQNSLLQIKFTNDGKMTGTKSTSYSGQYAASYRQQYKAAKDSIEFVTKLEDNHKIKIDSYDLKGMHTFTPTIKEDISFTQDTDLNSEYIYLNPMLFQHIDKNPFTQEERKLPVEFPHTQSFRLSASITIPENYVVDELPQSENIILNETQDVSCKYYINHKDNTINMNYTFQLNKMMFGGNEYSQLKDLWAAIVRKNSEMIVLKKKAQ